MIEDRLALLEAKARVHEGILLAIVLEVGVNAPGADARIVGTIERFADSYEGSDRMEPILARRFVTDLLAFLR